MIEQAKSSEALEHKRIRAALERVLYARFSESTRIREAGEKWQDVTLELVQTRLMPAIAEFSEESAAIMERLRGGTFASAEELRQAVVHEFVDFMLPRFSRDELQARLRRFRFSEGRVEVGTMLEYDPVKEGVLTIHVQPTILTDPRTWLGLWHEDLQMLADLLRKDPSLQDTRQIQGDSRIVYAHPKLFQEEGFHVTVDHEKKRGSIVISQDEFLARYSGDTSKS